MIPAKTEVCSMPCFQLVRRPVGLLAFLEFTNFAVSLTGVSCCIGARQTFRVHSSDGSTFLSQESSTNESDALWDAVSDGGFVSEANQLNPGCRQLTRKTV